MTSAFDDRIVRVGIRVDGEETVFEGLDIRARGTKFLSATQNQCEIQISNLTRERRNFLLTHATPLIVQGRDRKRVIVTLDVGRKSYGTFRLFEGDCFAANATQPPDIGITLRALTNNIAGGIIDGYSQNGVRNLRPICQQIADSMQNSDGGPLSLDFQATDKKIDNYNWTGSAAYQLQKLNDMGGIVATVENNKTLLVLDANKYRKGSATLIDMAGGMVGIPSVDDSGVNVRMLANSSIELGGKVKIISQINPAANGDYRVAQINFDITNRNDPFWYSLRCSNMIFVQGTSG